MANKLEYIKHGFDYELLYNHTQIDVARLPVCDI